MCARFNTSLLGNVHTFPTDVSELDARQPSCASGLGFTTEYNTLGLPWFYNRIQHFGFTLVLQQNTTFWVYLGFTTEYNILGLPWFYNRIQHFGFTLVCTPYFRFLNPDFQVQVVSR